MGNLKPGASDIDWADSELSGKKAEVVQWSGKTPGWGKKV
jgi:hypothetical protein